LALQELEFQEFERRAREIYDALPREFRRGVDGLVVSPERVSHPRIPDLCTLGECLTENHLSDFGSPDTTRSTIVLYWGSFSALAAGDPGFDWQRELWETLTHELRHHLEWLAGEDSLEELDYAVLHASARAAGMSFDPWYYRRGERVSKGTFRVEDQLYVELDHRSRSFWWNGIEYAFNLGTEGPCDLHFAGVLPGEASVGTTSAFPRLMSALRKSEIEVSSLVLVLVKPRDWRDRVQGIFQRRELSVWESTAELVLASDCTSVDTDPSERICSSVAREERSAQAV